jgi:hypothetical protein
MEQLPTAVCKAGHSKPASEINDYLYSISPSSVDHQHVTGENVKAIYHYIN